MRSDVIIVGAELDGLVAALRLLEQGYSVRIFCRGASSLHSAPGGIHLLSPKGASQEPPLAGVEALDPRHPYRLMGLPGVEQALAWFFRTCEALGQSYCPNGGNSLALTPAGMTLPTFAPFRHQASLAAVQAARVAVASFRDHRDFPAGLLLQGLQKAGVSATGIELEAPEGRSESVAIARAFDRLTDPKAYFRGVKDRLAAGSELVLFPALLGLEKQETLIGDAAGQGLVCLEVPTLPPSVAGMRLAFALERRILQSNGLFHRGVTVAGRRNGDGRVIGVTDQRDRFYAAKAFILASGGVLMGGLEVEADGMVLEPTFDLPVAQTAPLDALQVDQALDALHRTGVEVDESLRPQGKGQHTHDNLFVTGTTLGHWNPMGEASGEGVSIATGWAAAEAARRYLEAS